MHLSFPGMNLQGLSSKLCTKKLLVGMRSGHLVTNGHLLEATNYLRNSTQAAQVATIQGKHLAVMSKGQERSAMITSHQGCHSHRTLLLLRLHTIAPAKLISNLMLEATSHRINPKGQGQHLLILRCPLLLDIRQIIPTLDL